MYLAGEGSADVVAHDVHPEESGQIGPVGESAEESAQTADGGAADAGQKDALRHEESARQRQEVLSGQIAQFGQRCVQGNVQDQAHDRDAETHVRQVILHRVVVEVVLHGSIGADLNVSASCFHFIVARVEHSARLIDDDGIVVEVVELLAG